MTTEPAKIAQADAYALLSKPTQDLSDSDVLAIIENLRTRRITSLKAGKPDKPVAEAKAKRKGKPTTAEKDENTKRLLASLALPSIATLAKKD